ncbi:hypothetical protein [Rufibacter latericius]|uniref:Uncharacterized protein n=1 Tax=Rufibacter latericius TaxID=2487040 RepID=A0A3M9MN43_9BACT|nr:hypothetical protein [Rufibacter latericius]RNI26625.1 hypothetical protein EFB08_11445 [Rufibacter latericius]
MNKARRHELKMLKYKKRLIKYGLKDGEGKFYAFRSHGTPCSCSVCSHAKYIRAKEKLHGFRILTTEEVEASRCSVYSYAV